MATEHELETLPDTDPLDVKFRSKCGKCGAIHVKMVGWRYCKNCDKILVCQSCSKAADFKKWAGGCPNDCNGSFQRNDVAG